MKSINFGSGQYVRVTNMEDAKLVNDFLVDRDTSKYTATLDCYEPDIKRTGSVIIYGHNGFDRGDIKINSGVYKYVPIKIFKQSKEITYEIY